MSTQPELLPHPAATRRGIRALERDDLEQVASLYERVMRSGSSTPPPGLAECFERFFLDCPLVDPEIPSLVYEDDGRIVGFLGLYVRQMLLDGQPIRMACSGHFVTDEQSRAKAVGAFLIRKFFQGPQDLTMTDGATPAVRRLWERLGGQTALLQCMQWTKVFSPARFLCRQLADCSIASTILWPFAWSMDQLVRPLLRRTSNATDSLRCQDLTPEDMTTAWNEIGTRCRLLPVYDRGYVDWLMTEMRRVKSRGPLFARVLRDETNKFVGWYIYYLPADGIAQVVQIVATDDYRQAVMDHLMQHAQRQGALALTGRLEADLVETIANQRCWIRYDEPLSLIHSNNADIVAAINAGQAKLTRLDGEWWTGFHREQVF